MQKYFTVLILIIFLVSCKTQKTAGIQNTNSQERKPRAKDLKGQITNEDGNSGSKYQGYKKHISEPIIVTDKLSFGSGYNSATGAEYFSVLKYDNYKTNTEIIANATGSTGYTDFSVVTNKSELKKVLDISTSASAKGSYMGVSASGSYKKKVYNESKVNKFSQTAVVKAQYTNEPRVIINPEISESLINLAKESPKEFMRTAGDMFVSKIYTGGALYGLFELQERSMYEKQKNEEFISASVSYFGNGATYKKDVKKLRESFNSTKKVRTLVITEGGDNNTPGNGSLTAFLDYASKFKSDISAKDGAPIVLCVELQPYENIAGFPKIDFSPIRVYQKDYLEGLEEVESKLEKNISNAEFVLSGQNRIVFDSLEVWIADSIKNVSVELLEYMYDLDYRARSNFEDLDSIGLDSLINVDSYEPVIVYNDRPFTFSYPADVINSNLQKIPFDDNSPENDKYFFISGRISSQIKGSSNEIKHIPSYNLSYLYYRKMKFLLKKRRVYAGYSKPYFQVIFKDIDNGVVVYNKPYTGSAIKIPKNVNVFVKMVNPNREYYVKMKKNNYFPIKQGKKWPKGPVYSSVRKTPYDPPIVKIYEKNSKENVVYNLEKAKEKGYFLSKDFLSYDFDQDVLGLTDEPEVNQFNADPCGLEIGGDENYFIKLFECDDNNVAIRIVNKEDSDFICTSNQRIYNNANYKIQKVDGKFCGPNNKYQIFKFIK